MSPELSRLLPPLLAIAGMAAFFGLIIWLAVTSAKKTAVRFQQLATNLGLTLEPARVTLGIFHSAPRASGERRGKKMELFTYTTGSGKSRTSWCAISAQPRADGGLTFGLSRQGFGSKIAQLFGSREIQVGDPAFDDTWFIQTNRPDFFGAALLPEMRARLTHATRNASRGGSFKLEHGKVVYAEVGSFHDEMRCARFESVAEVICDLADVAEVHANPGR
ncbi:MAG TPA: hypothetical protein VHO24_15275 [Opitutaceae bacterium]|nr:hypothetical protein [Opitutaceae bacterium]